MLYFGRFYKLKNLCHSQILWINIHVIEEMFLDYLCYWWCFWTKVSIAKQHLKWKNGGSERYSKRNPRIFVLRLFLGPQNECILGRPFLVILRKYWRSDISQPAITCSKLTIKTLGQGVKLFKVNNKDTITTPIDL